MCGPGVGGGGRKEGRAMSDGKCGGDGCADLEEEEEEEKKDEACLMESVVVMVVWAWRRKRRKKGRTSHV